MRDYYWKACLTVITTKKVREKKTESLRCSYWATWRKLIKMIHKKNSYCFIVWQPETFLSLVRMKRLMKYESSKYQKILWIEERNSGFTISQWNRRCIIVPVTTLKRPVLPVQELDRAGPKSMTYILNGKIRSSRSDFLPCPTVLFASSSKLRETCFWQKILEWEG